MRRNGIGNNRSFKALICALLSLTLLLSAAGPAEGWAEEAGETAGSINLSGLEGLEDVTAGAMAITAGPVTYAIPDNEIPFWQTVQEGVGQIKSLPYDITLTSNRIKVIGYAYYKNLPLNWGIQADQMKFTRGNFADVFTNLDEEETYFATVLAICATTEPISFADESQFMKKYGNNKENAPFYDLIKMAETSAKELGLEKTSAILKGINKAEKGVRKFCTVFNRLMLLNNLDWNQVRALIDTWTLYGNTEMKEVAELFRKIDERRTGELVADEVFAFIEKKFLDIADEMVDKTIETASENVSYLVKIVFLTADILVRYSSLAGESKDMECAARNLEACKDALNHKLDKYEWNLEQARESDSSDSLTALFTELMYAGMNYAHACGIMEETYVDFIQTGKESLINWHEQNKDLEELQDKAEAQGKSFILKAKQIRNQIGTYNAVRQSTEKYCRKIRMWEHHCQMQGSPRNTLDLSVRWDGTLDVTAHFQGVKDFRFITVPYRDQDDRVAFIGNVYNGLYATLSLYQPDAGQIKAEWGYYGDLDPKSPINRYIMKYGNGVEPSVYNIAEPSVNSWEGHWQMQGHPENMIDINRTGDDSFHLTAQFGKERKYEYDFDLKDYRDQEGVAFFGNVYQDDLCGNMFLDLEAGGKMDVLLIWKGTPDEDNPLYPYLSTDSQQPNWQTYIRSDYRYELLEDGTVSITEYVGENSEVYIPLELDGYKVTRIGPRAFFKKTQVERVYMRDLPITTIESETFRGCEKLRFVDMPETLLDIGWRAFDYCISLPDIVLPDRLRTVGFQAFSFCEKLEEVYCPESIRFIDPEAFMACPNVWIYAYQGSHAEHYAALHEIYFLGPEGFARNRDTVMYEIQKATEEAVSRQDYSAVWAHRWVSETRPDLVL
ncbi:MAG: leucine-rich repeat domain-containing protein, partial [Clostridiales bacterium]|nr:leucine-rich repeat domain-containing protein [Clostridiales bacterium]